MIPTISISLIIILITALVWQYFLNKKKYQHPDYLSNLKLACEFLGRTKNLDDYLTWVERDYIKAQYSATWKFFKNKTAFYSKENIVKEFNELYSELDAFTVRYNQNYVKTQKEKLSAYFDNIEGKKLDDQQRTAVITDEYSNLIIAGAGSGKTLTILSKVQYLTEQKKISPQDILLLSFTKKTVAELNERLLKIVPEVEATTFHKLGYDIIKEHYNQKPALANENTLARVIREYLQKDIFDHPEAMQAYVQYVACYMNIPDKLDNSNSLGEKVDTEKGIDFQTLKAKCEPLNKIEKANLNSIQGERVKSVEELIIANFLYLNGIEYQYEKAYPHGEILYCPDFYLNEYDLYLEHFGVDENNQAGWLTPFFEKKYVEEMQLKRERHKTHKTTLLETYSYYNRDHILLEKLEQILLEKNVALKPRDTSEIYEIVSQDGKNFGREIIKLIESFINLSKSRRLDSNSLIELFSERNKTQNNFIYERQLTFLKFILPILEKYDKTLLKSNEIDFNDMINKAADEVITHKPLYNYKYIIIDEYQDISFSRFNLINQIREISGARLICVGDDWQSIYRFAGSDISLFSNFGKHVGQYEQLFIEQTYRNSQSVIDISSKFVQKNPKQIIKKPKSKKENLDDPVKIVHFTSEKVQDTFITELQYLASRYGNKSILVLGRHSFDIDDLIRLTPYSRIKYFEASGKLQVTGFEHMDIQFMTVHKSKGTEADNVIILNLRNNLLGFPNKMTDDPIVSLLLSDQEEYQFAEERRLFYVALTRTKNEAILLIPSEASVFGEELLKEHNYLLTSHNGKINITNCPYCQTGKLMIRTNSLTASQFLGCSHFPQCNQTYRNLEILDNDFLCPRCESGFMVKRNGIYGDFLGCTNYPRCSCKINCQ
ncbi:UvrD-helicase domain-containing protein [Flavobacterium humidisoli]|uniref:DNA 3'-5' helicase n=1 Tax=Flavobacterium humidisoli TaxID=2937442 RepID=A0ABY4LZL1_9FLAO|nr:UvrD-helicase domain-containing protein [Flavobacterium humidisoli]UPZ17988.1 UvrD-helicase domain-containing protein [Flavobacterium humidisoli]